MKYYIVYQFQLKNNAAGIGRNFFNTEEPIKTLEDIIKTENTIMDWLKVNETNIDYQKLFLLSWKEIEL